MPHQINENILITGGGGFLGSAIVKRLVKQGASVASFSRKKYAELTSLNVQQIQGDISDPDAVELAVRGKDLVFHVAAKPGIWGSYRDYYLPNVAGTQNVIAACLKHGVSQLVYTSSPSVVFDGSDMQGVDETAPYPRRFHSHYPQTKALAEQAVIQASLMQKKLKTVILRPHLIWGPGDNHLIPRIIAKASQLRQVGDGKNKVDTIYIDNAADAHILAAEKLASNAALSGNIYFISQDEPVLLWEMINAILNAANLPPVQKTVSHRTAWMMGAFLESVYKLFKISKEPRMTRFVADELATSHWFDISAARRDLGYFPQVNTQEGLEKLAVWLKTDSTHRTPTSETGE
ncbi:NAD-dependent epimerase/dehydratase family protein [Desulfococcaceae bacterium HSG9]|nr:NAD-dependent epimerase/dehydratase family protein [Desulfococcaceae bacterium HSG9]